MKYILFGIFTFFTTIAYGQVDGERIKEQAELTAKAIIEGDYETVVKFTYPKVVELIGGRAKMISIMNKGTVEMNQQGIRFDKVIIGEPSTVIEAGDELHCLVPQTIFMKVPKGKTKSDTYLLAVSRDKGNHWYFVDTTNLTKDKIDLIFPNYNSQLVIPPKKDVKFIKD